MPFPISEINFGGTFAFIVTLNNQLIVIKVNPIFGRLFFVKDLGFFLLDEEFRYISKNGRSEIYFFNQKGCNPLSQKAIVDVRKYLEHERKKRLEIRDLAMFVDKIRTVETGKALLETVKRDVANFKDEDGKALNEEQQAAILSSYLKDANFDFTVEKMADLARPKAGGAKLDDHTIAWLNAYFKEDIVSRYYLTMRQITDDKFKLKESKAVSGAMSYFSASSGKKHLCIVCINNARIDFDCKVKLEMNEIKGHYELITEKYGVFDHVDAKSRYKFGRQNIFCVMVETRARGQQRQIIEPLPEMPAQIEPPTMAATSPQAQEPIAHKKRGRPLGSKNRPPIDQGGIA